MTDPTPISPEIGKLQHYLRTRAIPVDNEFMEMAGLEYAGAERISEILGFSIPRALGIVIKYPGTEYSTVRLVPGGPRCPQKVTPHAYLSPPTDWGTVAGTMVICESPLKALTWSRFGYPAMSAGGVTTVYMAKRDTWCAGFPHAAIESGAVHTVLIAWDSDVEANHNVAKAQRVLARALADKHPKLLVQIHRLPDPPEEFDGDSWGCDDAHAYYGSEWFEAFANSTEFRSDPERDQLQDQLDDLSSRYVACLNPEKIINTVTGNMHGGESFCNYVEAWRTVPGEKRPIRVAKVWAQHPDRPTVKGQTYTPGADIIDGEYYNLWRPSAIVGKKGDISPWMDLIDDAVRDKAVLKLMIQCMAYQVQHRNKRLEKLLYFVGREVGTGKSTQAVIMKRILGEDNTGWVTKANFENEFNACWAAKELVVMDDIEKLKRDSWSVIKTHITSNEVTVNDKYVLARQQHNYATFYISANQSDILTTDADDRRVLMIHFEPTVLHREHMDPYWPAFHHWLNTGGLEAIAHYLNTLDLSDFDPHFYPPQSDIKDAALEATRDADEAFLDDFRDDPYNYVEQGREVITSHELWMIFSGEAAADWNTKDRQRMGGIISAKMVLKKAWAKQFIIEGTRTNLYWIPGAPRREPRVFGGKPNLRQYGESFRANIKKYKIKLSK